MIDDERTSILSLAGRTIVRIERDPEVPLLLCAYDEHDRLLFKATSLFDDSGCFDTTAIDNHLNDEIEMPEL